MEKKNVSLIKGITIFTVFTGYFFLLLYVLLPIIKSKFIFNNTITYWIIIGYSLCTPILLCAIIFAKTDGNNTLKDVLSFLCIKPFSRNDWKYSILGFISVIVFSGIIYGGSILLNKIFDVRLLKTQVWFMEVQPLKGMDKLILLLWFPMFFLNIFGEELLWRGYIQARLINKNMWFVYSAMWLIFHIPFGIDFVILLIPIVIIIPYIFSKQRNTLIGCFIHGLYNGPAFILLVLGIIK